MYLYFLHTWSVVYNKNPDSFIFNINPASMTSVPLCWTAVVSLWQVVADVFFFFSQNARLLCWSLFATTLLRSFECIAYHLSEQKREGGGIKSINNYLNNFAWSSCAVPTVSPHHVSFTMSAEAEISSGRPRYKISWSGLYLIYSLSAKDFNSWVIQKIAIWGLGPELIIADHCELAFTLTRR